MGTRANRYRAKQLRAEQAETRRLDRAQRRAVPTHPQIPSRYRDPITGVPLDPTTLKLCLHDPVSDRPIPAKIHTQQPEGALGGHCYTGPMKRRLRHTEPWHQIRERQKRRYWWTHEWAEREARAFFSADQVDAALAVKRDGADWNVVAARVGHTINWIDRAERLIAAHIAKLFDDGLVS